MAVPLPFSAVVTDLDGTIVRTDGTLTAATVATADALRTAGIPLILATARTVAGVRLLDQLLPHVTLAVCCGGALGWVPATEQTLWREQLDPAVVGRLLRGAGDRFPMAGAATYDGERWLMTPTYMTMRGGIEAGPKRVAGWAEMSSGNICMMSICHPFLSSRSVGATLGSALGITPVQATMDSSSTDLLDIIPGGVDKCTGVDRALERLGVTPTSTIVFGDGLNDLPMFRLCGITVAMRNAHPQVRKVASTIADSVDEEGFARLLSRLGVGRAGFQ